MQPDEKALWNEKYSAGSHSSLEPEPLLVKAYSEFLAGSPPGLALDVAVGALLLALWLAPRGLQGEFFVVSEPGEGRALADSATKLVLPSTRPTAAPPPLLP